jgi:hypothetical protein
MGLSFTIQLKPVTFMIYVLSVITRHMAKKVLDTLAPVVEVIKSCKIVIVLPILRYVHNKCCNDGNHIENFGSDSLKEEVMAGLDSLSEMLQVWENLFFLPLPM